MAKRRISRGRYRFTTKRKAALKKAQRISARKRRGKGNGGSSGKSFAIGAGAGVGFAGLVGAAYVLGTKTTSHKNTPGGSNNSHPMGTDPSHTAADAVGDALVPPKIKERADPQGLTTRLASRGKTPGQQTGGVQAPQVKGSTASAPAVKAEASKQQNGAVPPTPKGSHPQTSGTALSGTTETDEYGNTYTLREYSEVMNEAKIHDQVIGWKKLGKEHKDALAAHLGSQNIGISPNGRLFKKGPGSRRARKAAKTRARNAATPPTTK